MTKAVLEAEGEGEAARAMASILRFLGARRARQPACFADGAARPARRRGGGADWGRDRPGVFARPAGGG